MWERADRQGLRGGCARPWEWARVFERVVIPAEADGGDCLRVGRMKGDGTCPGFGWLPTCGDLVTGGVTGLTADVRPVIDLNADLGESFGRWTLGDDAALIRLITSANVACGFHAGDPATLRRTCELAVANQVRSPIGTWQG